MTSCSRKVVVSSAILMLALVCFGTLVVIVCLWVERNEAAVRLSRLMGTRVFLTGITAGMGCSLAAAAFALRAPALPTNRSQAGRLQHVPLAESYPGLSLREAGWWGLMPQAAWELSSHDLGRVRAALQRMTVPVAMFAPVIAVIAIRAFVPSVGMKIDGLAWILVPPLVTTGAWELWLLYLGYVDYRRRRAAP